MTRTLDDIDRRSSRCSRWAASPWDQYDNAQRIDETGFGQRLPSYTLEDEELLGAVERQLADERLARRMAVPAA